MPLESVTHISDLVVTNPTSTDPKSEGDNHLRAIKTALKTDFPNISGPVTKTHTQLNNTLDKTGDTMTGNLNFSGTGLRITGDFSNATVANRLSFQSSVANGNTGIFLLPNGIAQAAALRTANASDPTNAAFAEMGGGPTEVAFKSGANGTGTFLPMTFYTNNTERVRIDTSGNVGVGAVPSARLDVRSAAANDGLRVTDGTVQLIAFSSTLRTNSAVVGTTTNHPFILYQNNAEKAVIDTSGNFLVTGSGVLGYGAGSGGSVTQGSGSGKSTAVAINKPCGRITTDAANLNAGATVTFIVNNSSVSADDVVFVQPLTTSNKYRVDVYYTDAGGRFDIALTNITGSALAEAVSLKFLVHNVVTS